MEYHRRGPHQGFWRLKQGWNIPSDAEMLKMVEPEAVVLTESMQVGQRHLLDAGYTGAEAGDEADESKLTIEQRLAPWITTKNFLLATQGKAMLQLHGEGDPTGRGEAFSCIRISMKDIFVGADEDYEAKLGSYMGIRSWYISFTKNCTTQPRRKIDPSHNTGITFKSNKRNTIRKSSVYGVINGTLSCVVRNLN